MANSGGMVGMITSGRSVQAALGSADARLLVRRSPPRLDFRQTAYPFEPAMLSSPGAGTEGWRHDGFSQVATGVRAPVPGRGGLRRVAAGAPLGIGLRLPGVRPRPLLAARAQGPDPAMPGLSARDLGNGGHGHAPPPPAAEGLVHRRL